MIRDENGKLSGYVYIDVDTTRRDIGGYVDEAKKAIETQLTLLPSIRVVVALGKIAFDAYLTVCRDTGVDLPRPRPAFGHRATYALPHGVTLIASYHPSRQNTQTGRLTRPMFDAVFRSAHRAIDSSA